MVTCAVEQPLPPLLPLHGDKLLEEPSHSLPNCPASLWEQEFQAAQELAGAAASAEAEGAAYEGVAVVWNCAADGARTLHWKVH